jgi:phenylacetate-coenzyme A ligase PaaK-like adenylate-forming protein
MVVGGLVTDTVRSVADYEQTRARHVQRMLELLPEHLDRLRWSAERLGEERTKRLRELVATAKARSPWHRERLADVDEQALDETTLTELPTMDKTQLMENFDSIVTDDRVTLAAANEHIASLHDDAYFLGDLHAVASGGSSGLRGVFVWDWDGWAAVRLVALRQQLADRLSDPELAAKPPVIMVVAANHAAHFTTANAETFASDAVPVHRIPIGLPLPAIVQALNEADGDSLATYPSMLSALVGEAQTGRLKIRPRRIMTMAEPLFDEVREAGEQTWEAPVANMWGTSEAGIVAIGCFAGPGMHLADDQVIVEPVDEHGRPVPPGVPSHKVLVTGLANMLQPLIRYEITDQVVTLDEPCSCGSAYRRVADIQGRLDDEFVYANGVRVHPHLFRSVFVREPALSEYQVNQTADGAEILLCHDLPLDADALAAGVVAALAAAGFADARVQARTVTSIPRLESGKVKRFVPLQ